MPNKLDIKIVKITKKNIINKNKIIIQFLSMYLSIRLSSAATTLVLLYLFYLFVTL